jgi:fatty-acyl-CoA synthase
VEALLHRHPSIKESCVISSRDSYRGESVKALVVLHQSHEGKVTAQEIIEWAKTNMAAYKYPREIEFVQDLPRTATGKVLWRKAQAIQDERDACAPPMVSTPMVQTSKGDPAK